MRAKGTEGFEGALLRLFQSRSKPESSQFIRCREIVWKYKTILGEYASWKYGIPRSKLPYSIPEIERALIAVALKHLDDPNILLVFEHDFASLVYFIDDEEALAYRKIRTAEFRLAWLDSFINDEEAQASKRIPSGDDADRDSAILWAASKRKEARLAEKYSERKAVFIRGIKILRAKTEPQQPPP